MKFIVILLATIFLTVAPLQAQTEVPRQPSSPVTSSQVLQVLGEMTQRLEDMSATDASTTNAAVLLLGAAFFVLMIVVLIVVVWVARGGLKPLVDTVHSERQRAITAEQSETRMQIISDDKERELQRLRTQQAEALERTANILTGLETSEQAKQERGTAVKTINEHTDTSLKPIAKAVDSILQLLTQDKEARTRRDEAFDGRLDEAIRELKQLKDAVLKGDTDKLNPAHVPDTDPAASKPNEPVEPDIWQGDNPPDIQEP